MRCYTRSCQIYFKSKLSTVRVQLVGLVSCFQRPGVMGTSDHSQRIPMNIHFQASCQYAHLLILKQKIKISSFLKDPGPICRISR